MLCDLCKQKTDIIVRKGNKFVCFECSKAEPAPFDPPPVKFFTKWHSGVAVFHQETKREIYNFDKIAKECEFRLYLSRESLSSEKSPGVKELLIFRYFGKKRCALVPNYKWPVGIEVCSNIKCMNLCWGDYYVNI